MTETQNIKIAPSLLAADFSRIADEVARIEESGADAIHLDIMDGHFVSNLTMGPRMVAAVNRRTEMFLDVHLMIYNPYNMIEPFVAAGADQITFHFEATEDVEDTIEFIRKCNIRAGVAFSPETSASMIPKWLNQCDQILLMTVNPGFGGQAFMPEVLDKIAFTRQTCDQLNIREGGVVIDPSKTQQESLPLFDIQVDGGITDETAQLCAAAGANVFVAGTYIFNEKSLGVGVQKIRHAAQVGAASYGYS